MIYYLAICPRERRDSIETLFEVGDRKIQGVHMKVNTQKLFCLLLSVLIVLSFTACANGDSSAANGEEILPTEAAETAEPTQVP